MEQLSNLDLSGIIIETYNKIDGLMDKVKLNQMQSNLEIDTEYTSYLNSLIRLYNENTSNLRRGVPKTLKSLNSYIKSRLTYSHD